MSEKKNKPAVIKFAAQVWQIKTLIDGGVNVTLALSEKELKQVSQLLECKQRGAMLEIAAVPVIVKEFNAEKANDGDNRSTKRKQRYPYRD